MPAYTPSLESPSFLAEQKVKKQFTARDALLTLNVSYSRVTQLAWGHAVSYLSYVFWCQSHLVLGTAS